MRRAGDGRAAQHFRPEFLNRVDETILFHRLEKGSTARHRRDSDGHVRDLLASATSAITLTDAAPDVLIEAGYDPAYGARPLKRVIQKQLVDPLALKLIQAKSAMATMWSCQRRNMLN
jgi:ATP-dependent Clp protease ATP-binding subunit ClpB